MGIDPRQKSSLTPGYIASLTTCRPGYVVAADCQNGRVRTTEGEPCRTLSWSWPQTRRLRSSSTSHTPRGSSRRQSVLICSATPRTWPKSWTRRRTRPPTRSRSPHSLTPAVSRPWSSTSSPGSSSTPERFPDDSEPSEEYGRGAVYTRTCSGKPLRREPYPRRTELLDTYFRPYAAALTDAVTDRLNACGRAIIIDLHSYPEKPSAFEDPNSPRPALCIGADHRHTPDWLIDATRGSFASLGDIRENTPYSGCYVPPKHYGHDPRVSSVMIELRRDTYLTDPHTPDHPSVAALGKSLATLIDTATDRPADV